MNNKLIKILLTSIGIILTTFIIEIFGFNHSANSGYKETIKTTSVSHEEDNTVVNFTVDNKYINTISFKCMEEEDITYQVIMTESKGGENVSERTIKDTTNSEFIKAVTNIHAKVSNVKLIFEDSTFSPDSITAENQFFINWYRVLFFLVLFFLLAFILFGLKYVNNRLDISFAVICTSIGMLIILYVGTDVKCWDEQIHFAAAYNQSFLSEIRLTKAALDVEQITVPTVNTYEEKAMLIDYMDENGRPENVINTFGKSKFISYNNRGYITQSLMLCIARLLKLPFTMSMIFGKLGNLLLYVGICFVAINYAKFGKRVITMAALLPAPMFIACSYSYDPIVTAGSILAFSVFITEIMEPQKKLGIKSAGLFIGAITFASFPKAVYIPIILLALFFKEEKFYSKKQKWIFRIGIIAIFLVMMSTFVLPSITGEMSSDLRGGNTSVSGQLSYILHNPFTYTQLLLQKIVVLFIPYFAGGMGTSSYAYLGGVGGVSETVAILTIVVVFFVAFTNDEIEISRKDRIVIGCIIFATICLIWTALYLAYTPVGYNDINGVQPRYYLPLFVPLLFLCSNKKIQCNIDKLKYNRVMLLLLSALSFYGVYHLILKIYCM